MNLSEAFKVFELNVLRQTGIAVTPEQIGLKSDPIADLQAKTSQNSFSALLSKFYGTTATNMTAPTPPTPPADPTDATAMAKYQQDLLTYQNNIQIFNQRFMQMMLQQMQSLQQSIAESRQQAANSSSSSSDGSTSSTFDSSVGGIL